MIYNFYYLRQNRCSTSVRSKNRKKVLLVSKKTYSWFCKTNKVRLEFSRWWHYAFNIHFRLLKSKLVASTTEVLFIKINLRKKKRLMCCDYNPSKLAIKNFTYNIGKTLDSYIGNYDNFLVVGNFNSEISESWINVFYSIYSLYNLCDKARCVKSVRIWSFTGLANLRIQSESGKCGPEKLWIQTVFTQWLLLKKTGKSIMHRSFSE